VRDVAAVVGAMRSHPKGNGEVGVLGFCMGGLLAVLSAVEVPVDACVAFYAGGIEQHLAALDSVRAPMLLHFGGRDTLIPEDAVVRVRRALEGRDEAAVVVHPGVGHGFFFPARSNYDAAAARAAFDQTLAMLRQRLHPALPVHLAELRI